MRPTTINELNWLHDANVLAIEYRIVDGMRSLRLVMRGNPDCGYAEWAGRSVVIEAHDVGDLSFRAPGWIGGWESLDSVGGGTGIANERLNVRFAFHSGAEISLFCGSLFVAAEPS